MNNNENNPQDIKLSLHQINNMKHCLKKGWFATSPNDSWQEIVNLGFATCSSDPFNHNDVVYRLTEAGSSYLSHIMN